MKTISYVSYRVAAPNLVRSFFKYSPRPIPEKRKQEFIKYLRTGKLGESLLKDVLEAHEIVIKTSGQPIDVLSVSLDGEHYGGYKYRALIGKDDYIWHEEWDTEAESHARQFGYWIDTEKIPDDIIEVIKQVIAINELKR